MRQFTEGYLRGVVNNMRVLKSDVGNLKKAVDEEYKRAVTRASSCVAMKLLVDELCKNNVKHLLVEFYTFITGILVRGLTRNDPTELRLLRKLVQVHEKEMRKLYTKYTIVSPEFYEEAVQLL